MEPSQLTPFEFFVDVWWLSLTFHLFMYPVMWITKAGRWSSLWSGD